MNRRYSAIGLSNDGHLRVIALICAIALVGCAWIALEWLSKVDRTDGAPSPSSAAPPRFTAGNGHPATGDHPDSADTSRTGGTREHPIQMHRRRTHGLCGCALR
jgi:hypothetical protein